MSWLCSHQSRLTLPYFMQVCQPSPLLALYVVFLKGKANYNYTFKKYYIPVLSPYIPCSKEPRESTRQGPQMLPFSSVCSASREGSCQGANDHVLVFIKVRGSAIKCTARKSAGRTYLLKREVRKQEVLEEKQENEEQKKLHQAVFEVE